MSGDQDPGTGQARAAGERPAFLPPADGRPAPTFPAYPPPPYDPSGQGAVWSIAVIITGAVLLVSAFLPWAEARIAVDVFGRTLTRELGTVVGVEADTVVVAVPVLAMVAIGLAFWGLIGHDARVSALGAVPGMLSLLVCALFVLRLDELRERLAARELSIGYEVAVVFGWYLAVAMSLLVIGCSLARPVAARVAAVRAEQAAARQVHYLPPQEPYQPREARQPPEQPYENQPQEQRPSTGDGPWRRPD